MTRLLAPTAGSWTVNGDDISGGFDSRFNLTHITQQGAFTGGTSQRCGGNVTMEPGGQIAYITCPTTQFVYKIDLRDGSTTRHIDYTGTSPAEYPTGIHYEGGTSKLFVTFVRENALGTYPTYSSTGGIHRYDSSATREATAQWDNGTSVINFGADQMDYDTVNDLLIVGGKGKSSPRQYLVAVDPTFSDGSTINVDDGTNHNLWDTADVNDWIGSVVVLADTEWVIWQALNNGGWRAGDLSSGVSGFSFHSISTADATASRAIMSAAYLGAIGNRHFIIGSRFNDTEVEISELELVSGTWRWKGNINRDIIRSNGYLRCCWGAANWESSSNELPPIAWAWRTAPIGGAGSMIGRAIPDFQVHHQ